MDDVMGTTSTGSTWNYVGGFTASQLKWLQGDLNQVSDKENTLLIFDKNYSQVLNLLAQFKETHIMIGHTHYTQNYVHSNLKTGNGLPIYEHIHGAACGAWWNGNSTVTGEPNGYTVYTVKGNQITDWFLKGTNQDKDFQMRVFDGDQIFGSTYKLNWYSSSQKAGASGVTVKGNSSLRNCFVADVFDDALQGWCESR